MAKHRKREWLPLTTTILLFVTLFSANHHTGQCQDPTLRSEKYFGTPLGALLGPGSVSGTVYIVDESTIFIRGFTFSGSHHPLAFFMGGPSPAPDGAGFIIPNENESTRPLGDYKEKDIVIRLPEGRTVRDMRWLAVWSRQRDANLGNVFVPSDASIPSSLELPPLTGLAHGVRSGPISIIDAQTILVSDFHYDGQGPAGYWWVTRGPRQSPQGLRLKDENGTPKPLRQYNGESFLIRLPDTKTIYDFDWFGVYCEEFQVDFGHLRLPEHVRVPPSLYMLGVKPENKLNCEVLDDHRGYEIRWIMDGDDIVMQLVGKMQPREYMAFGLGKDDHYSIMERADAAVAWIDESGNGHVVDYYLSSKEQCVGNRGVCPDTKHQGANENIKLLHAAVVNGFSMVTFKRPQLGVDEEYDQHIYSDGRQAIIWAIGPLNDRNEVSFHSIHNYGNTFIDFARAPTWNCPRPDESLLKQKRFQRLTAEATGKIEANSQVPAPQPQPDSKEKPAEQQQSSQSENASTVAPPATTPPLDSKPIASTNSEQETNTHPPWQIPKIRCPKDRTLWAHIGPVGGSRGYQAITGRQGWGIAWYINGLLIPEIILKRGVTYTFLVEGGNDETNGARRHPLYITDSPEGGFEFKTPAERAKERVFGGVGITANGTILPTAEGRMCEWKITPATNISDIAGTYHRFEDFQKTLLLDCDQNGRPGVIKFTPKADTPNTVYYQCFTHRYLGWKIRIVDDCNEDVDEQDSRRLQPPLLHSASNVAPVQASPPITQLGKDEEFGKKKQQQHGPALNNKTIKHHLQAMHLHSPPTELQKQTQPQQTQQHASQQHRRPLVLPNQIPTLNQYGPYSSFYGGGGFQRHQLSMLPHTMLQGYRHHYQAPIQYQPQPMPQQQVAMLSQTPTIQQLNPYPIQMPQNIFNAPTVGNFYYHEPSGQIQAIQPQKPLPQQPMKKFGHRPPTQNNIQLHQQQPASTQQQQQPQFYGNRQQMKQPQQQQPQHQSMIQPMPSKRPFSVRPKQQQQVAMPTQQSFGPTSTRPPLHGGFVPITMDSTSNRPPVHQDSKSQNVWFPSGNSSSMASKPFKPVPVKYNKQPADLYRIVTTPDTSHVKTTTTTTTTTASPPVTDKTNLYWSSVAPSITTTVSPPAAVPTTIKLVNDSSIEILTFVPMEVTPTTNDNNSSASSTNNSGSTSQSKKGFGPGSQFVDMNIEEEAEESQRRLVMSSLNGFDHITNPNYEAKPGTLDHLLTKVEKTASDPNSSSGNPDENILSDVLRLISFNVPSGRRGGSGADASYTPALIPKR